MWELYATYREETAKMHAAETQLKEVREKRDQVKALIDADENEAQRKLLIEKKNNFQRDIERIKGTLKDIRGVLALSTQVIRYKDLLHSEFVPLLDKMTRHAAAGEGQWPLDPSSTDHLIDDSRKALEKQKSELFSRLLEVGSAHQQAEQERKDKQERLGKTFVRENLTLIGILYFSSKRLRSGIL